MPPHGDVLYRKYAMKGLIGSAFDGPDRPFAKGGEVLGGHVNDEIIGVKRLYVHPSQRNGIAAAEIDRVDAVQRGLQAGDLSQKGRFVV
jgi:hypothetical protein